MAKLMLEVETTSKHGFCNELVLVVLQSDEMKKEFSKSVEVTPVNLIDIKAQMKNEQVSGITRGVIRLKHWANMKILSASK